MNHSFVDLHSCSDSQVCLVRTFGSASLILTRTYMGYFREREFYTDNF